MDVFLLIVFFMEEIIMGGSLPINLPQTGITVPAVQTQVPALPAAPATPIVPVPLPLGQNNFAPDIQIQGVKGIETQQGNTQTPATPESGIPRQIQPDVTSGKGKDWLTEMMNSAHEKPQIVTDKSDAQISINPAGRTGRVGRAEKVDFLIKVLGDISNIAEEDIDPFYTALKKYRRILHSSDTDLMENPTEIVRKDKDTIEITHKYIGQSEDFWDNADIPDNRLAIVSFSGDGHKISYVERYCVPSKRDDYRNPEYDDMINGLFEAREAYRIIDIAQADGSKKIIVEKYHHGQRVKIKRYHSKLSLNPQ